MSPRPTSDAQNVPTPSLLPGGNLRITGDDLVAAGVPESPAIGRALDETLRMKLDGRVPGGREEELRTALEIARGESSEDV